MTDSLDKIVSKALRRKKSKLQDELSSAERKKTQLSKEITSLSLELDSLKQEKISATSVADSLKTQSDLLIKSTSEREKRFKSLLKAEAQKDIVLDFVKQGSRLLSELETVGDSIEWIGDTTPTPLRFLDIRDPKKFKPSKIPNDELTYDWAILCSWYATSEDPKTDFKYSDSLIIKLATEVIKEIVSRVNAKKMKHMFHPNKMTPPSRKLFEKASKKLPSEERKLLKLIVKTDQEAQGTSFLADSSKRTKESETQQRVEQPKGTRKDDPSSLSIPISPADLPPLVWIHKFLSLTGSAAYGLDREPNDVDLIVKAFPDDDGGMFIYLDPSLCLKITRIFEKAYPGKEVHWTPSPFGPNWDHYPLADLVIVPRPELVKEVVSEPEFREIYYDAKTKAVSLFKPIPVLKPLHGRFKQEEYSIDSTIKVVESRKPSWYESGIYIETKFDGDCVFVHKSDSKVAIYTSENRDISKKLPTLSEDIRKRPGEFILYGEIEHWAKGEHSPRQRVTAIIHKKDVDPEEKNVILNAFDILYINGQDIHSLPFYERIRFLARFKDSPNVKKAKRRLVHNSKDLRKAIEHFADKEGAEGSFLKKADFRFECDGATLNNIKFKKTLNLDVLVKKVHKVEGAEAWNYLTTLRDGTPCGNTYNSSIEAKVGDVLTIELVNLNRYESPDTGKVWFNAWSPRVLGKRLKGKEADTVETAEKLVIASEGSTSKKKYPKRYLDEANPFMITPSHDKKWRGMAQFDLRRKAVHLDFRYEIGDKELVTWTVFSPVGASKIPKTLNEARKVLTKEILPIFKETFENPLKKFSCKQEKAITFPKGTFTRDLIGYGPGEKYQPRYMWTFDTFDVEFGTVKPYFVELHASGGKHINGRIIFRQLENKERWKKTPQGLMTWFMFIAKDPTPYVLSRRAVNKKWIAPYGHSALPKKTRDKIPSEFQYWRIKEEEARRKCRDNLFEAMKKKRVRVLDEEPTKQDKKAIVSFSGGKDSSAALLWALDNFADVKAYHTDSPSNFPGTLEHVKRICDQLDVPLVTQTAPDVLDVFENKGYPPTGITPYCRDEMRYYPFRNYLDTLSEAERENLVVIMGSRKEESETRANLKDGPIEKLRSAYVIYPMKDLSDEEILEYLASRDIPLFKTYKYLERTGCWSCPLAQAKQFVVVREQYPELYERLKRFEQKHFPLYRTTNGKYVTVESKMEKWLKSEKFNPFLLQVGDEKTGKKSGQFKLQKQTWKGVEIVRPGPSRVEFHLLLKSKTQIDDFISDRKPPTSGIMKKATKKRWETTGDIKPKTKLNPTKNTPSKIELLDQGTFRWLDSKKTILKLKGKELRGTYTIPKDKDSKVRIMKKCKAES